MWENRFIDDEDNDCLVTVDGADFMVPENGRTFYSFKFKNQDSNTIFAFASRLGKLYG